MRLERLQAPGQGVSASLGNAVGLAGFITDGDPCWGAFVSGLHDAYNSGGRYVGPGPAVELVDGPVPVGSSVFERALQSTISPHALSRAAYAAIWFGAGSVETWLEAGRALLQGPELTSQIGQISAALEQGPGAGAAAARSVEGWVRQLMDEARSDVDRLRSSEANVSELEARLLAFRADAAEAGGDLEVGMMAWVRERQDAETRLQLYRDRERELRGRLELLEADGEAAECEACGQSLGERLDGVTASRNEEWESVVQDGRWWRRRRDQLEFKPDDLKEVESRLLELGARVDETAEALERSRVQMRELEIARVRVQHLEALATHLGGLGDEARDGPTEVGEEPVQAAVRLQEMKQRLEDSSSQRFRARVHAKVLALTGGRLVGGFPALYEDWSTGGRRGGGEVSVLELAARICLAELAVGAGLGLDSLVFPHGLDRLNGEDLPRGLAELSRLTRKVGLVLVKATEDVASAAPERFDLLFRVDASQGLPRLLRQRSGLGAICLRNGAA